MAYVVMSAQQARGSCSLGCGRMAVSAVYPIIIAKSIDIGWCAMPRRLCSANVVAIGKASDVNEAGYVDMRSDRFDRVARGLAGHATGLEGRHAREL